MSSPTLSVVSTTPLTLVSTSPCEHTWRAEAAGGDVSASAWQQPEGIGKGRHHKGCCFCGVWVGQSK
eukprot:4537513-Prymnesium_polylepis.1